MPAPPKDLLLVRLATVKFTPPPKGWREWVLRMGAVEVSPISAYEGDTSLKLLVRAGQVLDYRPKVSGSNEVIVPEKQRKEASPAIEIAANLIALAQSCRRTVSSPTPAVVFVASGDDGKTWLAERAGLQTGAAVSGMRAGDRMDLDDAVLTDLNDRPDGVALMVEALAQDHALGRFRDFIRVFERAFARPAKTLTDPVVAFLDPRLGYTDAEVKLWFEQYRDPATHADARNDFALEADAQPFIDRMEQAAMDVLMNKRDWRDPSADRRSTWIPMAGTSGPGGDIFVTKGSAGSIQARILDPYGAYPMDLAGVISTPPANWWPAADGNPSKDDDSGAKTAGE